MVGVFTFLLFRLPFFLLILPFFFSFFPFPMGKATTLDEIAKLVTDGKLIAEVQSVYSIYDIAQAFDDSQGGQVVGKLFINTTAGPDDAVQA